MRVSSPREGPFAPRSTFLYLETINLEKELRCRFLKNIYGWQFTITWSKTSLWTFMSVYLLVGCYFQPLFRRGVNRLRLTSSHITYRVFIKYCVFFQEFSKVGTSASPAPGCYWLYKRKSQQILYTRIALRAFKVSYSDSGEGGVAVNYEKTQFSCTPRMYE